MPFMKHSGIAELFC